MRVRLVAFTTTAVVSCDAGLRVSAAAAERRVERSRVTLKLVGSLVTVEIDGREWKRTADTVVLRGASSATVRVGDRIYRGSILVFAAGGELAVVNELGLEEYLCGVVPCEIGPIRRETFEAVKAQAVAARSFTLTRLNRRKGLGFQLFDTYARDQEYQGAGRETELGSKAVTETRGEVLLYLGEPAEALYHGNCGGITAQGSQPYLKPVRDTPGHRPGKPYCAGGKYHEWQADLAPAQYETTLARLAGVGNRIKLKGVTLEKDNVSGRVRKLTLHTDKGDYRVGGSDFRMVLGLRSTLFDLKLVSGRMRVTGRGWGHGCGLCQDGAVEMARRGSTCEQILAHYYSDVRIARRY